MNGNGAPFGPKANLGGKEHFGAQNRFLGPKGEFWVKWDFGPKKPFIDQNCERNNDGLSVPEGESGFPDSGPDSIHGRPGLRKHVAFSVPLHSNKPNAF